MKREIARILEESGFKNVAILSSGVLLSQAIVFVTQPIATRLYTPQDFGALTIITSLVSMFASVLNGQYDLCIVSAETEEEANSVTALAFYCGIFMSAVISIGIAIFNFVNPSLFGTAGHWIYIAIPFILITSISNVLSSYNNRYGQYKLIAAVSLYQTIASNITKLGFGIANFGMVGLIVAQAIAIMAGIKKLSEYFIKNLKKIFYVSNSELKTVLVKFKAQPLFSAPALFVTSYSYSIIPFFISILYGLEEVGYFYLSMAMLGLPLSLVSSSAGKVFFKNASQEKKEKGNFYNSFKSTSTMLTILSVIPFLILWLFAEPMFSTVFGREWFRSGTFVKLFIPLYWVRFIVTALVSGLIISGKQFKKLIIQCCFVLEAYTAYYVTKWSSLTIEAFLMLINYSFMLNYLVIFFMVFLESRNTNKIDERIKFLYSLRIFTCQIIKKTSRYFSLKSE